MPTLIQSANSSSANTPTLPNPMESMLASPVKSECQLRNHSQRTAVDAIFSHTAPNSLIGEGTVCFVKQLGFKPCGCGRRGYTIASDIPGNMFTFDLLGSQPTGITPQNVTPTVRAAGRNLLRSIAGRI